MSRNDSIDPARGVGLAGLTFLAFLVLKLCHVIDWPWIWVTAPLWAPAIVLVAVILCVVIVATVLWILTSAMEAVRRDWRGE